MPINGLSARLIAFREAHVSISSAQKRSKWNRTNSACISFDLALLVGEVIGRSMLYFKLPYTHELQICILLFFFFYALLKYTLSTFTSSPGSWKTYLLFFKDQRARPYVRDLHYVKQIKRSSYTINIMLSEDGSVKHTYDANVMWSEKMEITYNECRIHSCIWTLNIHQNKRWYDIAIKY